jgi:protein-S-isoprenylcysteine O-methyltransferase Ste14
MATLMWVIHRVVPALDFALPARGVFALLLAVVGFITGISGVVTFRRAKTTVDPTKPQSSSSLVTWGIYAITRNPMYLGGLVILSGWAIFLSNALSFLFLPAYVLYINRFQIRPEECALTGLFGQEYVAYQGRVRRWL